MAKASSAESAHHLADIPNVGPAMEGDLRRLGIERPAQLVGADAYALYERLCVLTSARQDPCVIDTLISAVRFMEGAPPHPWWHYTGERKAALLERRLRNPELSSD